MHDHKMSLLSGFPASDNLSGFCRRRNSLGFCPQIIFDIDWNIQTLAVWLSGVVSAVYFLYFSVILADWQLLICCSQNPDHHNWNAVHSFVSQCWYSNGLDPEKIWTHVNSCQLRQIFLPPDIDLQLNSTRCNLNCRTLTYMWFFTIFPIQMALVRIIQNPYKATQNIEFVAYWQRWQHVFIEQCSSWGLNGLKIIKLDFNLYTASPVWSTPAKNSKKGSHPFRIWLIHYFDL